MSDVRRSTTAWLGWVLFVGIILFGAGVINGLQGLVALVNPEFYAVNVSALPVGFSYTVWGWTLLVFGAGLAVTGCGVMVGAPWARTVGVVLAALNALVNLGFVTAYPMWTAIAVAFDVTAIYALVVHGGEAKAMREVQR